MNWQEWEAHENETHHWFYNATNYPTLVAHHGNWDIYRNEKGDCAAIAVVSGCRNSHFGNMDYLKHVPNLIYMEASNG